MLGSQLVELFGKDQEGGHLGGVSLGVGFEVSEVHAIPVGSVFLPHTCGSDVSSQLLLQLHPYLPAAFTLPATMVMGLTL